MAAAVAAAVLMQGGQADAQAAQPPLTAEAMWGLKRVGQPTLSPDGRFAVVAITGFELETDKRDGNLWLFPTDGGAPRQLTFDPAGETEAVWSPDGRHIAFVAKRGEDKAGQIYVLPIEGGEARRVTNVPTGARLPKWLPDSKRLAFVTRVLPELESWEAQGKRLKEREDSKMTARVWEKAPISHWDHWLDDRKTHIYIQALDGGDPQPVTLKSGHDVHWREPGGTPYDVSPDGKDVAYTVNSDETGVRANIDIVITAIDGGRSVKITEANKDGPDADPLYSPDGRHLAFVQRRTYGKWAENGKLMLYERASGKTRGLTEQWDRSAGGLIWAPDGSALYGSIDDAATQRVYRFDVKGGAPVPVTKTASFGELEMAGGVLVGTRQSFGEPPTLVRIDPKTGAVTQLSRFNDDKLAGVALGRTESVTYKGANGADIQMWVTYPPGFDPKKKYPLFLLIHGGPHVGITDTWHWRWNAQVFAGWGYVTAWHNFHGSSGFGEAFADSINPNWADMPYEDTIKAAAWFAGQPWIDAERMVAGGGSYGGYLASLILGRDHPFKTLIAHAAVYNLYTQEASDYGASKDRFGEFWERPEQWQHISPHMHAGNFKTPTLVIHGQLDYRVPVTHGIELFNILQNRGVPSRLVYYPNENHWILKPQNSVFWYQQVREWIARYAPPNPPDQG